MQINKIIYLSFLFLPASLRAMNENAVFSQHLKNKREALARVHEELNTPYQDTNVDTYKQNKLNKKIAIAESNREFNLVVGSLAVGLGTSFAVPVMYPNSDWSTKTFCGFFSVFSFIASGNMLHNWWNYKAPTMADVIKQIQAKLTKPYDGKAIISKKMGLRRISSPTKSAGQGDLGC